MRLPPCGSQEIISSSSSCWSVGYTLPALALYSPPERSVISENQASYLAGVAFSGNRGIAQVEVSLDNGATWQEAALKQAMGPYTWVLWVHDWQGAPGQYTVKVRATDGTGELQTEKETDTLPDGATGWHTRRIKVS